MLKSLLSLSLSFFFARLFSMVFRRRPFLIGNWGGTLPAGHTT